jgi:hypothetical protein
MVHQSSKNTKRSLEISWPIGFAEQIHIKVGQAKPSTFYGTERLQHLSMGDKVAASLRRFEGVY